MPTGYSLWLVPTRRDEVNVLKEAMNQIRGQVDADYSDPFEPHVTLLSGLSEDEGWTEEKILRTFKEAGRKWISDTNRQILITPQLKEVTTRGLYFQCILIALEKTNELVSINAYMRDKFNAHDQPPYFPHCSLLYGHLSIEQAQETIDSLRGGKTPLYHDFDNGISLGSSNSHNKSINHIELGAVELWNTNGSVGDWKRVETISLLDLVTVAR